jgi:hypothetical protein
VKVTGGHQAKLNDKSVLMAFIGYEMGSKTYRFYNPCTRRVCVTWDAVFMEERRWDWSKDMCDEEAGGFGTFSVGSIIVAGCHGHGHVGVMPVPEYTDAITADAGVQGSCTTIVSRGACVS